MITQELLLLEYDNLLERIDILFKKLITNNDQNYLQVFLTNPIELFEKELIFDNIEFPLQEISDGNRFLFSVLSNDLFYKWLQDYQNDIIGKMQTAKTIIPDKNQILQDIAGAMVQYGDKEIAFTFLNAFTQIAGRPRPRGHGDDDVLFRKNIKFSLVGLQECQVGTKGINKTMIFQPSNGDQQNGGRVCNSFNRSHDKQIYFNEKQQNKN